MGDLDDEELEATKKIKSGKIYYKNKNPRKVLNDYIKGKETIKEQLVEAIKILLVAFDETNKDFIQAKDLYNGLVDKIKAKIEECENEKNVPHEIDFKAFYKIEDLKNIEIAVLQSLLKKGNDADVR